MAKKAELNGTCLYLSQAFLFLLSDLAFHFFIYGANNLVMFTLPSKTERKKIWVQWINLKFNTAKLMYIVFHISGTVGRRWHLHRACSRLSLSLMESCKWDTAWIRMPSKTLSSSGRSFWRSHHREQNSSWLTPNTQQLLRWLWTLTVTASLAYIMKRWGKIYKKSL